MDPPINFLDPAHGDAESSSWKLQYEKELVIDSLKRKTSRANLWLINHGEELLNGKYDVHIQIPSPAVLKWFYKTCQ